MASIAETIAAQVERERVNLLDLTLRNPLLNYRLMRARGVEAAGGVSPSDVFAALVERGVPVSFLPKPDDEDDAANPPSASPRRRGASRGAMALQTDETERSLAARLLKTHHTARTFMEEQGVNTLFIALGMVEWYESDASDMQRKAPLILVPVTMGRSDVNAEFRIEYDGEEVGGNLSFIEKVRNDFAVHIPNLDEMSEGDEDEDADDEPDIDRYFQSVAAAVENIPRWRVDKDAVILGMFSFQKLLMYHDLDPDNWRSSANGGGGLADSRVVSSLYGGGGFADPGPAVAEGERLDDHLHPQDLRHVVDADSSQASVIADVSGGRDLVVQGPPGTGKSQTIVNLIADAIGAGRKVLFVSEKMAALEVVKRRLDEIHLGDACLELHSRKTSKRAVLDEIRRVSGLGSPITDGIQENMEDLERTRDALNAYADAMNTEIGETGVTPHQALGWTALYDSEIQSAGGDIPAPKIAGVDEWSPPDFRRKRDIAENLRQRLAGAGVPSEHPFWGTRITASLVPTRRRELEDAIRYATDGAKALAAASETLSGALNLWTAELPADAERMVAVAESVIPNADLARLNLIYPHWEERGGDIRALADAVVRFHNLRSEYDAVLTPAAWEMDANSLANVKLTLGYGVNNFLGLYGFRPAEGVERARAIIGNLFRAAIPDDALRAAIAREEIVAKYDGALLSSAWDVDESKLREMRRAVSDHANSLMVRLFRSKGFKNARLRMANLWRTALPDDNDVWIAALDALIEARTLLARMSAVGAAVGEWSAALDAAIEARGLESRISELQDAGEGAFGSAWTGDASQWSAAAPLAVRFLDIIEKVRNGEIPSETLHCIQSLDETGDAARIERAAADARAALPEYRAALANLHAALDLDIRARFGTNDGIASLTFAEQTALLGEWAKRLPELDDLIGFNNGVAQARGEGLDALVEIAQNHAGASEHLTKILDRARYESIIARAYDERPELGGFDFAIHSDAIRRFAERDRASLTDNRSRVASEHWRGLPDMRAAGEVSVLRREFEKRRRHMPIRRLMRVAGGAIQAVKPVFMMSPLSIANYVPPGSVGFDLVIFDEASQVKPVDALGALMRAEQVVVVGDTQQLPPTSFFDSMGDDIGDDGDDGEELVSADVESLLGLCRAQGIPVETLRWHYRSRHESLIALSNREFYDGGLVVFASPDYDRDNTGLRFQHLPDAVYENGHNREEAKAVAQAVMEHARRSPKLTLGVAAFSIRQADAIRDELETLRRQDASQETFFAAHPNEPFFVKNLENVQGDERDVIYISVGYGRDAAGQVRMNFGPLNKEGGHRRLNVLITRSRLRCHVFANLKSQDIALNRTKARGVAVFKTFLEYAETGVMPADTPTESGRDFGSPFQKKLADEIRARGYEVHEEVASGGRFIDMAVVDPNMRGRYALGVEFDGAAYHSARWARDRDRLRDQVLEGLGWRLHRVWSTDYFSNPKREVDRIVAEIESAVSESQTQQAAAQDEPAPEIAAPAALAESQSETEIAPDDDAESPPPPDGIRRSETAGETRGFSAPPYETASPKIVLGWYELHEIPYTGLVDAIEEIVRIEGPVHRDEVARRIANAAGLNRAGSRIRATVKREIEASVRRDRVKMRGDFLWGADMETPTVRDRSDLPAQQRKIELIAPEEIDESILSAVRRAFGIGVDDAIREAAKALGFARTPAGMRETIQARVRELVNRGALALDGDSLRIGD